MSHTSSVDRPQTHGNSRRYCAAGTPRSQYGAESRHPSRLNYEPRADVHVHARIAQSVMHTVGCARSGFIAMPSEASLV